MKNLKQSLPVKITAVLLSYVMMLVLVLSTVSVAAMGYFDFYFNSPKNLQENILGDMLYGDCHSLALYHDLDREVDYYYKDSNLFYTIETIDGDNIATNYNGEKIVTAEQYYTEDYIYTVYLAEDMKETDIYSVLSRLIITGHKLRYAMIFFVILSLIAFIVLLCFLYCSAGHNKYCDYIKLNALDKIPFDIYTAAVTGLATFGTMAMLDIFYEGAEGVIALFFGGTALYFLCLGFTMTFATRVKTGTLFKNTVIYMVLKWLFKWFKKAVRFAAFHIRRLPVVWQVALEVAVLLFFEFVFFVFNCYEPDNLIVGFIVINIILVAIVLHISITLARIKKGGEQIAAGDFEHKIDTKYMFLDFKDFAETINSINDGMQVALNERMKSERFKTELITNVSHDIKTPLTSIVNYVDLLKKEEIQNETATGYITVLERHSERLKKLVEDLVDASKATTGNLTVNLESCDVGVLLQQALGEFDERFKRAKVIPLLKIGNKNVIIKADARHLWRVFENLLSNICKYSQIGTRAYIDVSVSDGKVIAVFKNISNYQINLSHEELMERFVRGDKSRNSEGSGLGLSIAKSLVELQNGQLRIETDGDLFKAIVEFDAE